MADKLVRGFAEHKLVRHYSEYSERNAGLTAIVPDPENVKRVVHVEREQRLILHYVNGTQRSVPYRDILGAAKQQLEPMSTPKPSPGPPPHQNYRRIRLEGRL